MAPPGRLAWNIMEKEPSPSVACRRLSRRVYKQTGVESHLNENIRDGGLKFPVSVS